MKSEKRNISDQLSRTVSVFNPAVEVFRGIRSNTIPWDLCAAWAIFAFLVLSFRIDRFFISHSPLKDLYPYHRIIYKLYSFLCVTGGFWFWGCVQVKRKSEMLRLLVSAFKNAGLESKLGKIPNLVFDFPIDKMTRKMRLGNAGFPLSSFQSAGKFVESELGIYIDTLKENREKRVVDLIYSRFPMPAEVKYASGLAEKHLEYPLGATRSAMITTTLRESPHLLVAGQTGGGKSTFLRQLIVHLHKNNQGFRFLLIDLKGGLEFGMFEQRKNFVVVPSVLAAVSELEKVDKVMNDRMSLLRKHHCKDIDQYFKLASPSPAVRLNRHLIVVDEAAEMFLAGIHAKAKEVQHARNILSRVARQGRALGIHLVVATQRPDTRSLDPQVKANLTGVICFQMMNDSSSIAVLGNGRATDIPKIAGRAIWKSGIEMMEVQTPLLTPEDAENLLGPADILLGEVPEEPKQSNNNFLSQPGLELND